MQNKLYKWDGVFWSIEGMTNYGPIVRARCPNDRCELNMSSKYVNRLICPKCDFKVTLNKPYYEKQKDAVKIMNSDYWKDAEVVNVDGEMTKIGKEVVKDPDYWVKAYISKNTKGVKQLMVLVGSKKETDKTQLFVDIDNEKLSFDQNDKHPKEIFTKVVAIFKDTESKIERKRVNKIKNLEKS